MTFWAYLRFRLLLWALRKAGRLLRWLVLAAVLAAAAPVTVVAVACLGAWLRGWPPARLWRAALWALPMTAVYLTGQAVRAVNVQAFARAPVRDWEAAWHLARAGHELAAFVLTAPVAVPAGLALAGCLWAWRIYAIETGLSGRLATAPVVFDARQWTRQARTARARIHAPGTVPLTSSNGKIVMGATIRSVGHRWRPVMSVPYAAMGRHQVVIGSSGSGKTNLMMRTWAGWYAAALHAHHAAAAPRPLLVVLDCQGGPDARVKAERTRRLLHAAGCPGLGQNRRMTEIASLVLYAADAGKTAAFYRALGLDLENEDHGEGPAHFAAELGPVHFAIYPADAPGRALARRAGGSSFPGFWVPSLEQAADALGQAGSRILQDHQEMPWGCRVVAEDPDGRCVEVNQRGHCGLAG